MNEVKKNRLRHIAPIQPDSSPINRGKLFVPLSSQIDLFEGMTVLILFTIPSIHDLQI